jgi:aspartate carbamoyltransferase catalytic subunit
MVRFLLNDPSPSHISYYLLPEIDPEVDFDSRRAVYFRQMRYGLFVRHFTSFFH